MIAASTLRIEIEAALSHRIPSALTHPPRVVRPVAPTGIASLDELVHGGLPLGAITEIAGPECSGRTSLALSFLAQITNHHRVCAWIDVSDTLHPESAAAAGIDLARLLWVRCGAVAIQPGSMHNSFSLPQRCFIAPPIMKGLHGGGMGAHPRDEIKGMPNAVRDLLRPGSTQYASTQQQEPPARENNVRRESPQTRQFVKATGRSLAHIDQALRVADLLLQGGGFSAIVLDLGSLPPEHALRVPAATWFRYRAAAERTQTAILLLTQHACAKSSAGLVLRMLPGELRSENTIFTGIRHNAEIVRVRFAATPSNIIPLRKPPQSEHSNHRTAAWQTHFPWAGRP